MKNRQITILLLATCFLLLTSSRSQAESLPEGFPFRRPLAFKPISYDAPGENIAWAEFYTNGHSKPDGSDIRVTTQDKVIVPHKIMQVSADHDLVRIAFQVIGEGPYYVWWGNPKAEKPEKELDVQRGIYVEIFKNPGGIADNEHQLSKVIERAQKPLGAVFVNEIFLGYNPLGEEWNALLRYSGHFRIDKEITASFDFTVADTGWLKIDGKTIFQAYHSGLHWQVRDPKNVPLTVGWHSIEVVQTNQAGGPTAVAVVWKRPGEQQYSPLPGVLFAQVARASEGPLEKIGTPYSADFSIEPAAEAFSPPDTYLQRYTFEALYPPTFKPTLSWDFGDGQTMTGVLKKIHHYYLTPGHYTVTLKVDLASTSFTTSRRIDIKDRMYARFPTPPEDSSKAVAAVLKDYNLAKLTGEQALRGMFYFKKQADNDLYAAWGLAWAAIKEAPASDRTLFDDVFDLSRLLQLRKQYKESAAVYRLAAAKALPMELRLTLLRSYAITACDYLDDAAGVLTELKFWEKNINEAARGQVHNLNCALAYAAISKGDEKLARTAIDAAGNRRTLPYNEQQIRQGVLARNIENYIRTKDFDTALKTIDQWENEYPDSMWDGFTRTLRVKLYASEGRSLVAARCALQHAKANPSGFYAAELLYRASQNFHAAGEETQSTAALDLLKSKYPESPYANEKSKAD